MIESVLPFLKVISTASKAMAWFSDIRQKTKGDVRALVEELKENSRLCFLVVESNVAPEDVIPKLSTVVFDRLNENGFDFGAVKRSNIPHFEGIDKTNLASWVDKPIGMLIESIYDKIKNLRLMHVHNVDSQQWRRRIINIHKRILLLLRHAKS